MAIELLNLSSPNDGLGDTLRDGGVKINNNFTFLDTTKQNADADLTAIAGLAGTSGLLRKTAANTWALDTNSYLTTTGNGSGITNVNAATLDSLDSSQFLRSDTTAIKTAGSLILNDGIQLRLGTGLDFNIFHDGASNIINLTAGNMVVQDNGVARFTFGRTSGLFVCSQIDTGQGATEVYAMNQNVRTTDSPSFSGLTATNAITAGSFVTGNWTIDQNGTTLEFRYNGVTQMTLSITGELLVNDRAGEF